MARSISRRQFIGSGAATVGASFLGFVPKISGGQPQRGGGLFPGMGTIVWHPEATSGHSVDLHVAQLMVDRGLMALTGEADAVSALERLLPGLEPSSKIVIKINLIAGVSHCWTRWEIVQSLVNRLVETLDGVFPAQNITIFDQHDLPSHGYTQERFPGVNLSSSNQCSSGVMIPTPGRTSELSRFIAEAQFLINCPVLKNHGSNEFTLGMKNHYGSVSPSTWCGNYDGLLEINRFGDIKDKTMLVLLDGLFGTFVSGLGGGPDSWTLYPGNTPRRIFLGTDPCVVEYLGQQTINEQREASGTEVLIDHYLYRAGAAPYNLGIADPDQMTIEFVDASVSGVTHGPVAPLWMSLGAPWPNPFRRQTSWRLKLARSTAVTASVHDLAGRRVRSLLRRELPHGTHALTWDGARDDGALAGTGSYILTVEASDRRVSGVVTLVR